MNQISSRNTLREPCAGQIQFSDDRSLRSDLKRSRTLRALLEYRLLEPLPGPASKDGQANNVLGGRTGITYTRSPECRPFFRPRPDDTWGRTDVEGRIRRKEQNLINLKIDLIEMNQRLEDLKVKELELKSRREALSKPEVVEITQEAVPEVPVPVAEILNAASDETTVPTRIRSRRSMSRRGRRRVRSGRRKQNPYPVQSNQGYYLVSRSGKLIPPLPYPPRHNAVYRKPPTAASIFLKNRREQGPRNYYPDAEKFPVERVRRRHSARKPVRKVWYHVPITRNVQPPHVPPSTISEGSEEPDLEDEPKKVVPEIMVDTLPDPTGVSSAVVEELSTIIEETLDRLLEEMVVTQISELEEIATCEEVVHPGPGPIVADHADCSKLNPDIVGKATSGVIDKQGARSKSPSKGASLLSFTRSILSRSRSRNNNSTSSSAHCNNDLEPTISHEKLSMMTQLLTSSRNDATQVTPKGTVNNDSRRKYHENKYLVPSLAPLPRVAHVTTFRAGPDENPSTTSRSKHGLDDSSISLGIRMPSTTVYDRQRTFGARVKGGFSSSGTMKKRRNVWRVACFGV